MAAVIAHDVATGCADIIAAGSIPETGFVAEALTGAWKGVITVTTFSLACGVFAVATHADIVSATLAAQAAASVIPTLVARAVGNACGVALISEAEVCAVTFAARDAVAASIIDASALGCDLSTGRGDASGHAALIGCSVGSADLAVAAVTAEKRCSASVAQVTAFSIHLFACAGHAGLHCFAHVIIAARFTKGACTAKECATTAVSQHPALDVCSAGDGDAL